MSKSFEIVERVGISTESISDAVKSVIQEENKGNSVSWFNVIEERGRVLDNGKLEFQVTVKIGKKLSNQ